MIILEIKRKIIKNLQLGVDKTEPLVVALLQLYYWCALEGLQTCRSQDNIEGASEGDSPVFFLQIRYEEQR